ncbi:hypothetical protein [Marinilactibacillus sp. Marseille-P9653]|uniref:hypothetical protein n=1 Tax=Marinilactibacillus sp. Marseille-P9653 TaxID=2866583 RepID=UPI001CE3D69D|nr:hypothetical protein [Marinilactibacillus sp. Marseille-P9653]
MKKMIGLLLSVSLLGACNAGDTDEATEDTTLTQEEEAAVDDETQVTDAAATEEEMAPVDDEDLEDAEMISDLSDYEEFADQDTFDPSQLDAYLITDNPGTRVILFTEGDEQMFKSIYIKEDNRFKVVDLVENELLINAPL